MGNTPKLTLEAVMEKFTPEKHNEFADRFLALVQEFHDVTGLPAGPYMLYMAAHVAKHDELNPMRALKIVVEVMTGKAAQIIDAAAGLPDECADCPDRENCPDAAPSKGMVN